MSVECPHCGSIDIEIKEDIYICHDCDKWFEGKALICDGSDFEYEY